MTETDWLNSTDPAAMLAWLTAEQGPSGYYVRHNGGRPLSDRKLWLFVAAAERLWWGERASPRDRKQVETLEAIADGKASPDRLMGLHFSYMLLRSSAAACAREAVRIHDSKGDPPRWAALLREVVGNPWRPHARWNGGAPIANGWTASPDDWLAPAVLSVARAAYDLREWDRLPVLADALEDAGCTAEEDCQACGEPPRRRLSCSQCGGTRPVPNPILQHLRGPGPHVRGCHVLDLLLGLG